MSDTRFFLKKIADGSELELTGDLSIGRSQDSGLRLTEGNPSRNHARITIAPEGAYVEDLKSTNGTYVNGTRIEQKMRLASKDKVRFDIEEYLFRVEVPAPPPDAEATRMRPPTVAEPSKSEPGWIRGSNDNSNRTVFKTADELRREHEQLALARKDEEATGPVLVPRLRIYDSGAQPRIVELPASEGEWSVGSDEGREIRIQREGVSALHAKIVNSGKVWKVVDQVAANGTFVNGERVTVRYLHSGDRIDFGPVESVFEAPGLPTSPRAASASSGRASSPSDDAGRRKRVLWIAAAAFVVTLILLAVVMTLMR
ncbi:MAG TPA: FHA domain-containing protein [Steroidobacteraceae bacterium]|jgi:pSer/pThr/pTyr-binding forkhead associated (FHA) protein|nr:FHA domain-containing protein [Steroidobacteraceae bacterium]